MAKSLTLQITRDSFEYILTGEQKIEHRNVTPQNVNRYVILPEDSLEVIPIEYDELYLINGRKKDAPRLRVEVLKSEWVVFTDPETDKPLTYVEDGKEYYQSAMFYSLGKILEVENVGDDFEYKYAGKVPYVEPYETPKKRL